MKIGILPTKEMLAHSKVWIGDPRIRDALAADPIGKVLLDKLGAVHGKLSATQTLRLSMENRIAEMTELLAALDSLHDDLVRAIYFAITAAAHACKDADKTRELWDLRDMLFPGRLSVTKASYMGQSGAAVEVRDRVTPGVRGHLRAISLNGRTLDELLDEWLDTAERMGRLVHERSSLVASMTRDGSDAAKVDRNVARREWLQVSQGLLANLPFMTLPAKIGEEIVASLARSVHNAEQRRNEPGAEPSPDNDDDSDIPADDDVDANAASDTLVAGIVADTPASDDLATTPAT